MICDRKAANPEKPEYVLLFLLDWNERLIIKTVADLFSVDLLID